MRKMCVITASALAAMVMSATAEDGAAIYAKDCAKCHGADGKGATAMGKKLKCKDLTTTKPGEARIEKSIKEGVKEDDKVRMKAFTDLSDADVKAVTKHVGTLK